MMHLQLLFVSLMAEFIFCFTFDYSVTPIAFFFFKSFLFLCYSFVPWRLNEPAEAVASQEG